MAGAKIIPVFSYSFYRLVDGCHGKREKRGLETLHLQLRAVTRSFFGDCF